MNVLPLAYSMQTHTLGCMSIWKEHEARVQTAWPQSGVVIYMRTMRPDVRKEK